MTRARTPSTTRSGDEFRQPHRKHHYPHQRSQEAADHRRTSEPPPSPSESTALEQSLLRLSEVERQAILDVVRRDLDVRCMEKQRLR